MNKKDKEGGNNEEVDVSSLKDDIDRKLKQLQEMVEGLSEQHHHGQTGPLNDSKGGKESNVRPEDGNNGHVQADAQARDSILGSGGKKKLKPFKRSTIEKLRPLPKES